MSHSRPPAGMVSSIIIPTPTSPFRFLILDCPSNETLPNYIPRFQEYNVKHIFRIADDSFHYETKQLEEMGITVHDELKFEDGTVPTAEQVKHWIDFLKNLGETTKAQNESVCPTVAVHCVSGVGRAPVLVALACIEHNIDTLDAIEIIRKHRRGALNKAQVKFLANFKSKHQLLEFCSDYQPKRRRGSSLLKNVMTVFRRNSVNGGVKNDGKNEKKVRNGSLDRL